MDRSADFVQLTSFIRKLDSGIQFPQKASLNWKDFLKRILGLIFLWDRIRSLKNKNHSDNLSSKFIRSFARFASTDGLPDHCDSVLFRSDSLFPRPLPVFHWEPDNQLSLIMIWVKIEGWIVGETVWTYANCQWVMGLLHDWRTSRLIRSSLMACTQRLSLMPM